MATKKKKAAKRASSTSSRRTSSRRTSSTSSRRVPFLRVGDFAKLVFREDGKTGTERMWVRVLRVVGRSYVGQLDNRPIQVRGIRAGDQVTFPRSAVIERMRANQGPTARQRAAMAAAGGNIRLL